MYLVKQNQTIEDTFEAMWNDYLQLNPEAQSVYQLFSENNDVVNDHVAFRTFGIDGIRVEDIAKPLLAAGYQEEQSYIFEAKKLRAKHYSHPSMPLVFISELIVEEFSSLVLETINKLVSQLDFAAVKTSDFLYSGRSWNVSSFDYNSLLQESEYAAWVAAFGYRANHFTVSINHLEQFDSIAEVNKHLKANGFQLNTSGGEIKGSKQDFLEQSSTLANHVEVQFSDASMTIPSCFYEFAVRYPMGNGQLFKGFVASSADKIFESTDIRAA